MMCKYLYADWCHKPSDEIQEKCHWDCFGDVKNCLEYEHLCYIFVVIKGIPTHEKFCRTCKKSYTQHMIDTAKK